MADGLSGSLLEHNSILSRQVFEFLHITALCGAGIGEEFIGDFVDEGEYAFQVTLQEIFYRSVLVWGRFGKTGPHKSVAKAFNVHIRLTRPTGSEYEHL